MQIRIINKIKAIPFLGHRSHLALLALVLMFTACNHRLPEDKMVAVLTDFYLYGDPAISYSPLPTDSISLPLSVFKKHTISQAQFEDAMNYYMQHPKEMKELFEKVKTQLTERVDSYRKIIDEQEMAQNLWHNVDSIVIDSVQPPQKLAFHLPIDSIGNYTIKATVRLFENDSTQDPAMVAYFLTKVKKHKRDTINKKIITFNKQESAQQYTLAFSIKDTNIIAFEGYWLLTKEDTTAHRQHISLSKLRILQDNDSTKTILSDILHPVINAGNKKQVQPEKLEKAVQPVMRQKFDPRQNLMIHDKINFEAVQQTDDVNNKKTPAKKK